MNVCRWCVVVGFLVSGVALMAFREGDSRDAVLREWGKPVSSAARGDVEYLLYPGRGRVTIEGGRVREIDLRPSIAGPARELASVPVDRPQGAPVRPMRERTGPVPSKPAAAPAPLVGKTVATVAPVVPMPAEVSPAAPRGAAPGPKPEIVSEDIEAVVDLVVMALYAGAHALTGFLVLRLVFRYWEIDMMARHWVLCAFANTAAFVAAGYFWGVFVPTADARLPLAVVTCFCVPVLCYSIYRASFSPSLRTAVGAAVMTNAGVYGVMILARGLLLGAALQHRLTPN